MILLTSCLIFSQTLYAAHTPVELNVRKGEEAVDAIKRVFGTNSIDSPNKREKCLSHDAEHISKQADDFDGLTEKLDVIKFTSHGDLDLDCINDNVDSQQKSGRNEIKTPRQTKTTVKTIVVDKIKKKVKTKELLNNVKIIYENDKSVWLWKFKLLNFKAPYILEDSKQKFIDAKANDDEENVTVKNAARYFHIFQAKGRDIENGDEPQNLPADYKNRYYAAATLEEKNDIISEYNDLFDPTLRLSIKQRIKENGAVYDALEFNYLDETQTFHTLNREDLNAFEPTLNNHWYQAELKATWSHDGSLVFNVYPLIQGIDAGKRIAIPDKAHPIISINKPRIDLWRDNFESIYPKWGLYFGRQEIVKGEKIFYQNLPDNEMLISDIVMTKE